MGSKRPGRGFRLWSAVLIAGALVSSAPQAAESAGRRGTARSAASGARRAGLARRTFRPRRDVRLVAALRGRALDAEPAVTTALRSTVDRTGGALVDLDHRIKPSGSVLKKIRRDRKETGLSIEETGRAITDVLRYKVVLPFASYERTRLRIVHQLERRGFAVVKSKDNWGTRYPGHNLKLAAPGGYLFEVQFQTAESHAANRRTHGLYRRLRETEGDGAAELERRIFDITGAVAVPPGVVGQAR